MHFYIQFTFSPLNLNCKETIPMAKKGDQKRECSAYCKFISDKSCGLSLHIHIHPSAPPTIESTLKRSLIPLNAASDAKRHQQIPTDTLRYLWTHILWVFLKKEGVSAEERGCRLLNGWNWCWEGGQSWSSLTYYHHQPQGIQCVPHKTEHA